MRESRGQLFVMNENLPENLFQFLNQIAVVCRSKMTDVHGKGKWIIIPPRCILPKLHL